MLVVALVLAAFVGYRWWHDENDFCGRVRSLPDITTSITRNGTPASGLDAYAAQLDRVASVAPDAATRSAAETLASAQRAVAQALAADPTSAQAVTSIAAASGADVQGAQSQLQAAITQHCK